MSDTTTPTLAELREALTRPFDARFVTFKPKSPHRVAKGQERLVALALAYVNVRYFYDRLNAVAFGLWDTPAPLTHVAGNKLVVTARLRLCGRTFTDYGEAFLTSAGKDSTVREEENSATECWSQGFRRACVQIGIGRYLYELPKVEVPYDPNTRRLVVDHYALACFLYRRAGLSPDGSALPAGALERARSEQMRDVWIVSERPPLSEVIDGFQLGEPPDVGAHPPEPAASYEPPIPPSPTHQTAHAVRTPHLQSNRSAPEGARLATARTALAQAERASGIAPAQIATAPVRNPLPAPSNTTAGGERINPRQRTAIARLVAQALADGAQPGSINQIGKEKAGLGALAQIRNADAVPGTITFPQAGALITALQGLLA